MPNFLKECFWDTNINTLDIIKNKQFIISRIFSFGNDTAVKWMLKTYTREDIIETARNSRNFTLKTARFLKNVYNLKEEEMMFFINAKNMNDYYFM